MKNCTQCNTSLLDDARFCHDCGAKVIHAPLVCPKCNASNLSPSKFCIACGFNFEENNFTKSVYPAKYLLNFENTLGLAHQIKVYFIHALEARITEEHHNNQYSSYLGRLEESEFGKRLDLRMRQLAEEAYLIHSQQTGYTQRKVDYMLTKNFDSLLDHFIILYCKDLNEVPFQESILTYAEVRQGEFDLQKMILDYLYLDNEKETTYTDFIVMPINKLKNASQAFLFPEKDEKIMIIADQTIFGSCKEGFAMTEKGIYWKAHFEKAQQVKYADIKSVLREKEWLTINGLFFNVNSSLNIKMLKLLKKLKEVY